MIFMAPRKRPSEIKAPGGLIMKVKGEKLGPKRAYSNRVPFPKISLKAANAVSERVNPRPIPRPSATEFRIGFFEAKASARPKMMQFTTMSGTKMPNIWYMG